jgi:thioredoxin reductase (NADPH)
MLDVLIIGGGPCGLSAAIECTRHGLKTIILEKKCLVHSIYSYPTHMQFFSTPETLEIGDIPFTSHHDKPFRHEALAYYRGVSDFYQVQLHSYEEATKIERQEDSSFLISSLKHTGEQVQYDAKYVVIATGYFDHPNLLGIPGEDTPKVSHYFTEAHPYAGTKVVIIGGSNSAVDAAMELIRVGAQVTVVCRGENLSSSVKPWVKPIFDSMVAKNKISLLTSAYVSQIHSTYVEIKSELTGEIKRLENDFVLALTGFRPDRKLLLSAGVDMIGELEKPTFNPDTMESNVPGLYVAGVIASGRNANEVFIETGRGHGTLIAKHIIKQG